MVTPKFFAYVDAPADQLTPEADIVAMFSEGVYEGNTGQRFTGFGWTVPDHADESVYGLVIPDNFEFTRIIANPDTFHEDVTALWPQQVDLDFNGVTFHQYIAIDPLDWAAGGAGQRRYALEGGDIPAGGGLISPITAGSLREHIQTDLSNTALQRLLDGANGLVNRQYGEPEQQRVTLAYPRGNWSGELPLPERAATIQKVEYYGSEIDAADYTLSPDGFRVLRNEGDWLSGEYANEQGYRVHYTAASDLAIRVNCIIELVRLDVAHTGEQSTTVAGVTQSQRALRKARADILSALNDRGRAWVR